LEGSGIAGDSKSILNTLMKDVILISQKMRFILQRKETCISILTGYMGIKGIYNFPPNLPEQKKNHTQPNINLPPPFFLDIQPKLDSQFSHSFVSRQVATQPMRWP
jgi:hypothetical protein